MFEPTDYQPSAAAEDDSCDEVSQRDWIIVPMDSINSIMISHHCAAVSARSSSPSHLVVALTYCWYLCLSCHSYSVIFINENENGEKRENNEFVNEN